MMTYTAPTKQFYKQVQKIMRDAGYQYTRGICSASEDLSWRKEGCPRITLSGWHGTGAYSTNEKVCHDLYVDFEPIAEAMDVDLTQLYPTPLAEYQARLDALVATIKEQI